MTLLLGKTGLCRGSSASGRGRGLSVSRSISAGLYVDPESIRQGLWELPPKAPPAGSLEWIFLSARSASVCRQMWGGGLTRGTKWFLKLLLYLASRFQNGTVCRVTWVFKHVMFFFSLGLAEIRERKNVSWMFLFLFGIQNLNRLNFSVESIWNHTDQISQ